MDIAGIVLTVTMPIIFLLLFWSLIRGMLWRAFAMGGLMY